MSRYAPLPPPNHSWRQGAGRSAYLAGLADGVELVKTQLEKVVMDTSFTAMALLAETPAEGENPTELASQVLEVLVEDSLKGLDVRDHCELLADSDLNVTREVLVLAITLITMHQTGGLLPSLEQELEIAQAALDLDAEPPVVA